MAFQSTLPARGATGASSRLRRGLPISIHAPRTGSDRKFAGGTISTGGFQSTLPARGATVEANIVRNIPTFQSTLPARGATSASHHFLPPPSISIHAPRTGSD